jgi:hypothetical protein
VSQWLCQIGFHDWLNCRGDAAGKDASARPAPRSCLHEPPYPDHETVLVALLDPELCVHAPSQRCQLVHPHPIARCWEFDPPPVLCAHCGRDLAALQRFLDYYQRAWDKYGLIRTWWPSPRQLRTAIGFGGKARLWERNHIQARAEGGSNAQTNLETLCLPCHRRHTKNLLERLAKAKRRQRKFAPTPPANLPWPAPGPPGSSPATPGRAAGPAAGSPSASAGSSDNLQES